MNPRIQIDPIYGRGQHGFGFFSNYRACLHRLISNREALETHTPYISWKNTFFVDDFKVIEPLHPTLEFPENHLNPFDLWFDQEPLNSDLPIIRAEGPIDSDILNHTLSYYNTPELRLQQIIDATYIHLKKDIQNKINKIYSEEFDNEVVLGILARGTDNIYCNPENGVFYPDAYKAGIDKILELHPEITKIYVVCDDQKWIEELHGHFPQIYHSPGVHRWRKTTPYNHGVDDWYWPYNNPGREKHCSTLGEEIIIQTKLLGKCDYVLGRHSGILCGTVLWNERIKHLYRLDEIL